MRSVIHGWLPGSAGTTDLDLVPMCLGSKMVSGLGGRTGQ